MTSTFPLSWRTASFSVLDIFGCAPRSRSALDAVNSTRPVLSVGGIEKCSRGASVCINKADFAAI